MSVLCVESPTGPITIRAEGGAITGLRWGSAAETEPSPLLAAAAEQLDAYFAGTREAFDLPLAPRGNPFQQRFYAALCAIPYGHTRTYGELAKDLEVSAQAIGQACGANPIPIFIPCHRVLGATGLGGFSGGTGVETKVALLRLERAAGLLI